MQKVAVINAGLGDLSLGFQMAGFQVVAAYESEKKAIEIHRRNLKVPIYPLPEDAEEIDIKSFQETDVLAARLSLYPGSRFTQRLSSDRNTLPALFPAIVDQCRPQAVCLLVNTASVKGEHFNWLLSTLSDMRYQIAWQIIDVARATGFPVKERMACAVAVNSGSGAPFQFPEYGVMAQLPPEQYLQLDRPVDPWCYRLRPEDLPRHETNQQIYCWDVKAREYVGTDAIQWSPRKLPLVNEGAEIRKITLREVANLKGFPSSYTLECPNRSWLYQKLMYSGNIAVIRQIADALGPRRAEWRWSTQQVQRALHFEMLFGQYLKRKTAGSNATFQYAKSDAAFDFQLADGNRTLFFELKTYNSISVSASKLQAACKRLVSLKEKGEPVLVVGNMVPEGVKAQCREQYGVSVWDVGNLLWLFDEFPDIRNDFIASLDYAIERIEPKPPVPSIFQETPEAEKKEEKTPSLAERLLLVKPGHEPENQASKDYESICIEILKFVLGDYLTLWRPQETTDDGLHRFDLCCRIKNGANQDFFDTIKHYFNTKYIVFEFKNYSKQIKQKEIYTTEKYLYEKALRKVAIIISRYGASEPALQAAKGSLREQGKLILCLSDKDLLDMIKIKEQGEQEPADFLGTVLDNLLMHLEK